MRTFFISPELNMTCQIRPVLSLPVAMSSGPCSWPCIWSKTGKWKSGGRVAVKLIWWFLLLCISLLKEKPFLSFERSFPFSLPFSDHVVHSGLTCTGSVGGWHAVYQPEESVSSIPHHGDYLRLVHMTQILLAHKWAPSTCRAKRLMQAV